MPVIVFSFFACTGRLFEVQPLVLNKADETGYTLIPIDSSERLMRALAAAYPNRIGPVEFRDGDWAFYLDGIWFFYAEGRVLPEHLRERVMDYSPLVFFNNYPAELPVWTPPSEEFSTMMRQRLYQFQSGNRQLIGRPTYFFDTLWQSRNRVEAFERVERINFLGQRVTVHRGIIEKLRLVEERIFTEAKVNYEVRQWIDSLGPIHGWAWREIANSRNRSFHSYGVALDILPRNLRGLQTYWAWTARHTPDFWTVPYSRRYHPPDEVILAFEAFGFIWGGKWRHFDTMHFEYRPEVFILNNIPNDFFTSVLPSYTVFPDTHN